MKKRLSIFVAALGILGAPLASADKPEPIKALLIIGGCCHDYAVQKDLIKNGLEGRINIKVDIDYSPEKGTKPVFKTYEKENWAEGYDVILHDECAAGFKEAEMAKRVAGPHIKGVPAVNLHCAMHSYRVASNIRAEQEPGSDGALWFEFLGIQSSGHGPKLPIDVAFEKDASPITKGFKDYTSDKDELYNCHKVFDGVTVLAKGKQKLKNGKEAEAVVAWKHEYGPNKARVVGTTLGHFNEIVGSEEYLNFVARSILWSVKKLDDEGKPAEGYWLEK